MPIEPLQENHRGLGERVVGAALHNPVAAAGVVGVAGLAMGAVMLTRKIHTEWHRVHDLSAYDLERYTNLIKAYRENFPETEALPEFWILEGNKPRAAIDFEETGLRLKAEAVALNKRTSYDHDVRATILTHIGTLFISMSKRSWIGDKINSRGSRSDGIEVMFYTHLADWLLCTAPNFDADNKTTVDEYQRILDYCSTIQLTVVTDSPREAGRNNPNSTLHRIIGSFDSHHKNLKNLHNAKRFNGLVKQLKNNVLGLASSVIDALYLLIDGVTDDALIVDKFISPDRTTKNHATARKTVLGEFLYLTLSKAGILHSKYNSSNTLTIQTIEEHLRTDTIRQKKSGHRPFSIKSDDNYPDGCEKAKIYLENMLELNRLVLEAYYLNQELIQSSLTSEFFGESWMYGNQAGKAALLELLLSTTEVTDDLKDKFQNFWTMYYGNDFIPYVTSTHANTLAEEHKPIVHIQTIIRDCISTRHAAIRLCVKELQAEANDYSNNEEKMHRAKVLFIKDVLEHRRYRHREDTENYRIAAQELEHLSNPEALVRLAVPAPRAQEVEVISPNLHALSMFESVEKLLDEESELDDELSTLRTLQLPTFPPEFHFRSHMRRKIFETFLKPNASVVNWYHIFSFFQNISPLKMDSFSSLYIRVSAVMHFIYVLKKNAPRLSKIESMLIDALLKNTIVDAFTKDSYYSYQLIDKSRQSLTVEVTGNIVAVSLNTSTIHVSREQFTNHFLACIQDTRVNELEKQKIALKDELQEKDSTIVEQDSTIVEQNSTIVEQNSTIVNKDITLRNQEQEIERLKALLLQAEEALAPEETQENGQAGRHRNPYHFHQQSPPHEGDSREHANVHTARI